MSFCYVDTETLGLDLVKHDIFELAYAIDDEPVQSAFISHDFRGDVDPTAAAINGYGHRFDPDLIDPKFEQVFHARLSVAKENKEPFTLVGAAVDFDAYRIAKRWNWEMPWNHRLVSIGTYAMPIMRASVPQSLTGVRIFLSGKGYDIPKNDHTAAGDVETTRACHLALADLYWHGAIQ